MVLGGNKKEEGYFVNTYETRGSSRNRAKGRSSRFWVQGLYWVEEVCVAEPYSGPPIVS